MCAVRTLLRVIVCMRVFVHLCERLVEIIELEKMKINLANELK